MMKSNICNLSKDTTCLSALLDEVEKMADATNLQGKNKLRLRLLAEELCGILPGLINNFDGEFWVENRDSGYELHVELNADSIDADVKKSLISISTSGKNAAAKGIMGKIRDVVENMLLNGSSSTARGYYYSMGVMPYMSEMGGMYSWSLRQFRDAAQQKKDDEVLDGLEQSIVSNLADDILVGVRGRKVEMVVKKTF